MSGRIDGFRERVADARRDARIGNRVMKQSIGAKNIARGLATVGIAVVILNEIFNLEVVNNSSGPFADVIDSVESIGGSALTLTVLAFLVLAGAIAMQYMDRF